MFRYFEIQSNIIHSYNVLLLLALVVGSLMAEKEIDSTDLIEKKKNYLRLFIPFSVIIGLLGGALLEMITQQKTITIENFNSGFTFYGGLIAGVLFTIVYSLLTRFQLLFLLNFFTLPLVVGHAIGRVGCFFAGCCYGKPTSLGFGLRFPEGSIPYHEFGACMIHPTQLYESLFLFMLFFALKIVPTQLKFSMYCLGYGLFRFFVEFIRADSRGTLFELDILTPSQVISVFFIISGLVIILWESKLNIVSDSTR